MVEERTWDEFRNSKLLWFVNRSLHLFGWAICVQIDEYSGRAVGAYPARVKFRGFDSHAEEEGFTVLSGYIADNIEEIALEASL